MMKALSINSINSKAPLTVSATDSGSFCFADSKGNSFMVGFVEDYTLMDSGVYQFFIDNMSSKKGSSDKKVVETIVAIFEEFFNTNESAVLYICDAADGKQSARDRLFSTWFQSYKGKINYTLSHASITVDGVGYYASLLLSNDNPRFTEVLSAFNKFTLEMTEKIS